MPLESGSYLSDLVITNPTSGDPKSQGDDHLRLIKTTLRVSFSGFLGAVVVRGTDTGTGAAYVVAPSTAVPSLQVGMRVQFAPVNANTGAATLAVSGLVATPIVHANGSALTAGDIPAGRLLEVAYDGTSFQIVGGSGFLSKTGNAKITGTLAVVGVADFREANTLVRTLPYGTPDSNEAVSVAMLNQYSFQSVLPSQAVDGPRWLRTYLGVASWEIYQPDLLLMRAGIV